MKEVSEEKENFILLSKADLLTQEQRDTWAEYFTEQGIRVAFWSAFYENERLKKEVCLHVTLNLRCVLVTYPFQLFYYNTWVGKS